MGALGRTKLTKLAVALSLLGALVAPAQGARSTAKKPVRLTGVTTFRSAGPAVARVVVPSDTAISLDDGITFKGASPFTGMLLAADVPKRDGPSLFFGRFSEDLGGGATWHLTELETAEGLVFVPAGRYVLYALTDDSAIQVRIVAEGLRGQTTLKLRQPARLTMSMPDASISPTEAGPVYSAGATGSIGGHGLAYRALIVRGGTHVAGHYGGCLYQKGPATPENYLPYCPDGAARGFSTVGAVTTTGYKVTHDGVSFPLTPGSWAQSVWYDAAATPTDVRSLFFFLSY